MNSQVSRYHVPTKVIYGIGAITQNVDLASSMNINSFLVVTDPGIEAAGLLENMTEQLKKGGISCHVFSDVEANPSVATVDKGLKVLQECNCDGILAVGGGSPLDVGKAIGTLATNGGSISDYEGVDKVSKDSLPMIAVPTTAGTASEITINIVINDPSRNYKLTVVSQRCAAKVAILDPELTLTLPTSLTASTGLDALVHAIESYTSLMSFPVSEALALKAISLISSNLRQAVYNGSNLEARNNMLMGSYLAGLAFNNTRLGNCHAMSHPLSAFFNTPHGVTNAILIPHIMEFNVMAVPDRFAVIAEHMGEDISGNTLWQAASKAVSAVRQLNEDVAIPQNLDMVGAKREYINTMAKDAMKSGNILVNPRKTRIEDIIALYEKAF